MQAASIVHYSLTSFDCKLEPWPSPLYLQAGSRGRDGQMTEQVRVHARLRLGRSSEAFVHGSRFLIENGES